MQITLVRHTAVSPEWQVICYGNTDIPLADTFDEEAPRVAAQIDPSLYDRILSSPLTRALKLAPVSYTHLDVYKRQTPARESARGGSQGDF